MKLGCIAEEIKVRFLDFSNLILKADQLSRPIWVTTDRRIFLEAFSPLFKISSDFLSKIAEPICRLSSIHEYSLSQHSLYGAASFGYTMFNIINVLNQLSKALIDKKIKSFIHRSTQNIGKVKLILKSGVFWIETNEKKLLEKLICDRVIRESVVGEIIHVHYSKDHSIKNNYAIFNMQINSTPLKSVTTKNETDVSEVHLEGNKLVVPTQKLMVNAKRNQNNVENINSRSSLTENIEYTDRKLSDVYFNEDLPSISTPQRNKTWYLEIIPSRIEFIKERCLPQGLNFPLTEEYEFYNDYLEFLGIELGSETNLRPYQTMSLKKIFNNGRARSGIIVLPCGAGKTLTGISVACRINKSVLVLCTNSVSVDQWKSQFENWCTTPTPKIYRFTLEWKELFTSEENVTITTYNMIAFPGKRNVESQKIIDLIKSREWGLVLLDEVHVVPAKLFRSVVGIVKAHCKIGLTATLVREDDRIEDLNFLIGPKLYEANWVDLTTEGYIAHVLCCEIRCPMTKEFHVIYLKKENEFCTRLLYIMNPNKIQACHKLILLHEMEGHKIIVFSDNVLALHSYATKLKKPIIYGSTSYTERASILKAFGSNGPMAINTIFLSKVGDNSLDIADANVLIQISSHGGSRRQETQRMGRILRAKKMWFDHSLSKMNFYISYSYDAFFYTLVGKDTEEIFYSIKRQKFLLDQGYSYKIVTDLIANKDSGLYGSSYNEQEDLLKFVLKATEVYFP
jgi:DNA excision repair protein ERCC-3